MGAKTVEINERTLFKRKHIYTKHPVFMKSVCLIKLIIAR